MPFLGYGASNALALWYIGYGLYRKDREMREKAYKAFFPPLQWGFNLTEELFDDDEK